MVLLKTPLTNQSEMGELEGNAGEDQATSKGPLVTSCLALALVFPPSLTQ